MKTIKLKLNPDKPTKDQKKLWKAMKKNPPRMEMRIRTENGIYTVKK